MSDVKSMLVDYGDRQSKKTETVELKLTDMLTKNDFAKFRDYTKEQFTACDTVIATLATRYELKQTNDKIMNFFNSKLDDYSEKTTCKKHFEQQNEKNYTIGVKIENL